MSDTTSIKINICILNTLIVLVACSYILVTAYPDVYLKDQDFRISLFESVYPVEQKLSLSVTELARRKITARIKLRNEYLDSRAEPFTEEERGILDRITNLVSLEYYQYKPKEEQPKTRP